MIKKILVLLVTFALFMTCGKNGTEPESPPVIISGPEATFITPTYATISWATDQAADSKIQYGQIHGIYDSTSFSDVLTAQHTITIEKLKVYTLYYYIVISKNDNGADTSAENSFTTGKDAQLLLARAWIKFEQGHYGEAIFDFELVLSENINYSDANVGLGWSYSFLDSLEKAKEQFDIALSLNNKLLDAYVGRGMVLLSKSKYNASVSDLNFVLTNNPIYAFSHYTDIDYKDIHIALAEAYFYQSKYDKSQEHVNFLWPGNGLDPDEGTTWVIDSVSYATYQEALLSAIEKLKTIV
jgi:tetratricopeptide (TPR) repeat protein